MPPRHPKARSVASSVRKPPSEKLYQRARSEIFESDDSDGMSGNRGGRRDKQRQYIDPWDLENYIYLRSKTDPTFEEVPLSESPAGEPINSRFYYVPGEYEDCRRCCAGADELTFYNERFGIPEIEEPINEDYIVYNSYTDGDSSSTDLQNSCDSASTLRLCTPNFGLTRIVLPKPPPLHELHIPPPPSVPPSSSYDYYEIPSDSNYYSLNDCMECLQTENVPIYATNRGLPRSSMPDYDPEANYGSIYCSTPYHFGLDKKGLLQIDYSCNWNNLHRYITKGTEPHYN